jgi:ABC-type Fe3+ transport system permease subunit
VLWPLALPGIVAGAILCFILAMNAYATPVLLGGPQFKMMAPLVFGQFRLNNWPFGAAVAFVLMTATLVLTASANVLGQRRYRRRLSSAPSRTEGAARLGQPSKEDRHLRRGHRRGGCRLLPGGRRRWA